MVSRQPVHCCVLPPSPFPAVLAGGASDCPQDPAAFFPAGASSPMGAASAARFLLDGAAAPATPAGSNGRPVLSTNGLAAAAAAALVWPPLPRNSASATLPSAAAAVASAASGESLSAVEAGTRSEGPSTPSSAAFTAFGDTALRGVAPSAKENAASAAFQQQTRTLSTAFFFDLDARVRSRLGAAGHWVGTNDTEPIYAQHMQAVSYVGT